MDLLVIGWGKAGKTLAGRYAATGKTVAIVERSPQMYGGTCINVACVPTKDLVVSAEARRESDDPAVYFREAVAGRDALVAKLNAVNHAMLADKEGVTVVDGTARFTAPRTVSVTTADGEVEIVGEHVVVGTGAVPARLPVPGGDGPRVHDSTTIQHVDPFPERLVVIGAGFIGLELASMFAHLGSEVTVVDGAPRLLPSADEEVADEVRRTLEDRGVRIIGSARVEEIVDDGTQAVVRTDSGEHAADAVLVAVGRTPVTRDLGLDAAGIDVDDKGFVAVDDQLRTSDPQVFAVGDINGGPQFTYISLDDNRIVWDALEGAGARRRSDREAVPTTTFITPPLSQVGMTVREARDSGRSVLVASKPVAQIAAMPRPKILGETHGLISFVVDADDRQILGATLFCTDSQELVNLVALAMRAGVSVDELRDGIWTHPSSTEALNEVLAELQPLD